MENFSKKVRQALKATLGLQREKNTHLCARNANLAVYSQMRTNVRAGSNVR